MAPKDTALIKGRRQRKFREARGRLFRWTRNIILTIIAIILLTTASLSVLHIVKTNAELEILDAAKLHNMVEVENGREINCSLYGAPDAIHTIVPISGVGVQDFTVFSKKIVNPMKEGLQVALIDRAGYGLSDDSHDPQTVEQIISDYRTALEKAGAEAPYVLLAHEFGGVYATYWSLKYPDEVEGIIYLDATPMLKEYEDKIKSKEFELIHDINALFNIIGFQRLRVSELYIVSADLSNEESDMAKMITTHSMFTFAQMSELELLSENYKTVMDMLEETDIPKVYVSASTSFRTIEDVREYYDHKNHVYKSSGKAPFYVGLDDTKQFTKDAQEFLNKCIELTKNETKPFVESLGNCELTSIPGDKNIYEQKLECLPGMLLDFMRYIEGSIDHMELKYEDSNLEHWEQYRDAHIDEIKQNQDKIEAEKETEPTTEETKASK